MGLSSQKQDCSSGAASQDQTGWLPSSESETLNCSSKQLDFPTPVCTVYHILMFGVPECALCVYQSTEIHSTKRAQSSFTSKFKNHARSRTRTEKGEGRWLRGGRGHRFPEQRSELQQTPCRQSSSPPRSYPRKEQCLAGREREGGIDYKLIGTESKSQKEAAY